MRTLAVATLTVLCLFAGGCSDPDTPVATDTAPTTGPATPTPTAEPTVGTYPDFAPTDYEFTLETSCFCAGLAPTRITVENGVAVSGVVVGKGRGKGDAPAVGTPVEEDQLLTIADIVERANDTSAASVQVEWPAGQDFPTSVYVDQSEQMADEEVGYTITDVVVSP